MEKLNIQRPAKLPPKRTEGNSVYDQVAGAVQKSITIPVPTPVSSTPAAPAQQTAAPVTTKPAQPNTSAMTGPAIQPAVNQTVRQPNIPVNPAAEKVRAQKPPKAAPTPTYVFNFGSNNPFSMPQAQ